MLHYYGFNTQPKKVQDKSPLPTAPWPPKKKKNYLMGYQNLSKNSRKCTQKSVIWA